MGGKLQMNEVIELFKWCIEGGFWRFLGSLAIISSIRLFTLITVKRSECG